MEITIDIANAIPAARELRAAADAVEGFVAALTPAAAALPAGYQKALGARLRAVRVSQGLSLAQVAAKSEGALTAGGIGMWERGDRAVNLTQIAKLAWVYRVPVHALIPEIDLAPPLGSLCDWWGDAA